MPFLQRLKIFLLIPAMIALMGSLGFAQQPTTHQYILHNGLTVLITEMPQSSSVSVYGLVRSGSADEGRYLGAGVSHFMEHMVFKGTQRRGVGEIPKEVQALGGTINASTHLDYTIFTLTVPKGHLKEATDILSDMLLHAKFDPEQLQHERKVVLREMNMDNDRPERHLSDMTLQTVYQRHPYRIPVIGFPSLLKKVTRDELYHFYKQRYQPSNMIVSIAGAVTADDALKTVKKFFGDYPRGRYFIRNLRKDLRQVAERRDTEYYPTELLHMAIAYQGIDILNKDLVPLDALSVILGGGESSRLYQSLREDKKLVNDISSSDFTPEDPGVFEIDALAQPGADVDKIVSAVDEQIQRLKTKGISADELQKVVNDTLKSRYMGNLTSWGIAYQTAVDEAMTGDCNFTKWYLQAFARLTPEDIVRVAKKYLRTDRRSIVVLKPESLASQEKKEKIAPPAVSKIQRFKLKNGLTVLLREDHSQPLAWIDLVALGGVYADPDQLAGLSHLVATTWIKGSKHYSKEEIIRSTAQKGISLSSFSGRQSLGIRFNLLARDLPFCLKMLGDFLSHPDFSAATVKDEKDQIKTSIMRRDNRIHDVASMALYHDLFAGHPLGRTELGTEKSVDRMTRKDVVDFYRKNVSPNRAVLSIFGDIDAKQVRKMLNDDLSSWKNNRAVPEAKAPLPTPVTSTIHQTIKMDKEQAMLMFGFQAESFYFKDRAGLELLGAVLGAPFKGRMFSVIRDQKALAYTLGGGFVPAKNSGALLFSVQTVAKNVDGVKKTFRELIDGLRTDGVTVQELDSMKAYLIGRHARSLETSGDLAFETGLDELYGLGYLSYQDYVKRVNKVSVDDIKRLAQKYLSPQRMAVVTVLPDKKTQAMK